MSTPTRIDPVRQMREEAAGRFGWSSVAAAEGTAAFRRPGQTLHAGADRHWLALAVTFDADPAPGRLTWRRLLCASRSFFLVKYGLDGGRPRLLCELPRTGLTPADCAAAVEALSVYANREAACPSAERAARVDEGEEELFSPQELIRFFRTIETNGWGLKGRIRLNHWQAYHQGRERRFDVFVSFDRSWVYFQIPILHGQGTRRPRSAACQEVLYRRLLGYNQRMHWAKFGLDERDEVILGLDVPAETFDLERFRQATDGLAACAAEYAAEVQVLTELDWDPELMGKLTAGGGAAHVSHRAQANLEESVGGPEGQDPRPHVRS